jgi:hypothetical protein
MTAFGQPPGGGGFGPPPGSSPGGFGPPPGGGGFGPPPGGPYGQPPGGGYGPPMGGPPQGASGMAIASLVLAIVSFVMCGPFTAIPGLIIGKIELGKIERGESPESGKILAQIGFWANTGLSVLYLLFICLYVIIIVAAIGTSASTSSYGGY